VLCFLLTLSEFLQLRSRSHDLLASLSASLSNTALSSSSWLREVLSSMGWDDGEVLSTIRWDDGEVLSTMGWDDGEVLCSMGWDDGEVLSSMG